MGTVRSKTPPPSGEISFDHFVVLRAIGKGGFGKVCIVRKRDTKELYAMKYMSKASIVAKQAVKDVLREVNLLSQLDHPFIVKLWFSFQDEEDVFLVMDLLLGGDLRYHLTESGGSPRRGSRGGFSRNSVQLYAAEMVLALEYLREKKIIHRDIKPSNILLDSKGHCYVTDFSVACACNDDRLPSSLAGTKPYIAPEMLETSEGIRKGYGYSVDWWSLGVTICELLTGARPYHIPASASEKTMLKTIQTYTHLPSGIDPNTLNFLLKLLTVDPETRMEHVFSIRSHPCFSGINWDSVYAKTVIPKFIPKNQVNADPCHELEELLIESKPLHKKKSRLKKLGRSSSCDLFEAKAGNAKSRHNNGVYGGDDAARRFALLNREFVCYSRLDAAKTGASIETEIN